MTERGYPACEIAITKDGKTVYRRGVCHFDVVNAFVLVDLTKRVALYFGVQIMGCQYGYHVIHPILRDLVYECLEEN